MKPAGELIWLKTSFSLFFVSFIPEKSPQSTSLCGHINACASLRDKAGKCSQELELLDSLCLLYKEATVSVSLHVPSTIPWQLLYLLPIIFDSLLPVWAARSRELLPFPRWGCRVALSCPASGFCRARKDLETSILSLFWLDCKPSRCRDDKGMGLMQVDRGWGKRN